MNCPNISIIIPVFNRSDLLKETVESIMSQSFQHWECLLVDDGSCIEEKGKIKQISSIDKRIRLIERTRLPKGRCTCRNIGIEQSKGDYIIFLDSDDLLANDCLEGRYNSICEDKTIDFTIFNYLEFTKEIGDNCNTNDISTQAPLTNFLHYKLPWPITSPIYKSEIIKGNLVFNEKLSRLEDPEFAIRLLLKEPKYKIINRIDWYYRTNPEIKSQGPLPVIKSISVFFDSICHLLNKKQRKDLVYYVNLAIFGMMESLDQLDLIRNIVLCSKRDGIINLLQHMCIKMYFFLFKNKIYKIPGIRTLFYHTIIRLKSLG